MRSSDARARTTLCNVIGAWALGAARALALANADYIIWVWSRTSELAGAE